MAVVRHLVLLKLQTVNGP